MCALKLCTLSWEIRPCFPRGGSSSDRAVGVAARTKSSAPRLTTSARLFLVEMSGRAVWGGDCPQMSGGVLPKLFPTLSLESLPYIDGIFVTVQNLGLY